MIESNGTFNGFINARSRQCKLLLQCADIFEKTLQTIHESFGISHRLAGHNLIHNYILSVVGLFRWRRAFW